MRSKKPKEPTSWPHQFFPTGQIKQGDWGTTISESKCAHCGLEYWVGREPKPIERCPDREDGSEFRKGWG